MVLQKDHVMQILELHISAHVCLQYLHGDRTHGWHRNELLKLNFCQVIF